MILSFAKHSTVFRRKICTMTDALILSDSDRENVISQSDSGLQYMRSTFASYLSTKLFGDRNIALRRFHAG